MRAVTHRDVAKQAGVSQATVSRALQDSPMVSAEIKERVRAVAKRLGYRRNPLVSAHMAYVRAAHPVKRHQTLAMVSAYSTEYGWKRGSAYLKYWKGALARAEEHGFSLEHFWLRSPGMTPSRLSNIMQARGISGVLIMPCPEEQGEVQLEWDQFASATLGFISYGPRVHSASAHHYRNMMMVLTKLRSLGYQRIGFAFPPMADRFSSGLFGSIAAAEASRAKRSSRVPPLLCDDVHAWTPELVVGWFERHRPEVVVSIGIDEFHWLEQAGYAAPREAQFVTLCQHTSRPDIAGVHERDRAIGAAGVDLVVEQIFQNSLGVPLLPKSVLIDGDWVDGDSLLRP